MARRGLGRQVAHLVRDDWRYRQPILLSTPKPNQTIRNAKSDYDDEPIEYTGEQPGGEHNSTESNANRAVKHAEEYFDFCNRLLCAGGKARLSELYALERMPSVISVRRPVRLAIESVCERPRKRATFISHRRIPRVHPWEEVNRRT